MIDPISATVLGCSLLLSGGGVLTYWGWSAGQETEQIHNEIKNVYEPAIKGVTDKIENKLDCRKGYSPSISRNHATCYDGIGNYRSNEQWSKPNKTIGSIDPTIYIQMLELLSQCINNPDKECEKVMAELEHALKTLYALCQVNLQTCAWITSGIFFIGGGVYYWNQDANLTQVIQNLEEAKDVLNKKKELNLEIAPMECDNNSFIFAYAEDVSKVERNISVYCISYGIDLEPEKQERVNEAIIKMIKQFTGKANPIIQKSTMTKKRAKQMDSSEAMHLMMNMIHKNNLDPHMHAKQK